MFRGKFHTIHFVGIGGIGMSGIAEVLLTLGFHVSGSDLKESASILRLRQAGASIFLRHSAENVVNVDVVVRSSAIRDENPEIAEAHRRLIPVIHRAEMLAELMRLKYGIAIAGSHGKTTTTSMVATLLGAAGMDPTVVIGGKLDSLGGLNAKLGKGDYLVAEADESDGSFLHYSPTVALITNIDPEHMEHFGTMQRLEEAFVEFANRVPFYGYTVLCQDHPNVQRIMARVRRRVVSYGFSKAAVYRAGGIERHGLTTMFKLFRGDELLGEIELGMPGNHNVSNATGAIAVAMELGIDFANVQQGLHGFTGVERRFTVRGHVGDIVVVDDYGHHPTEIEATLTAAESAFPTSRIVAVFQPHRYTRFSQLWNEFQSAFRSADLVIVCPVYAAGEPSLIGIDHQHFSQAMHDRGYRGVIHVDSLNDAADVLRHEVRAGDVVITLGAGDVNRLCDELVAFLGSER